MSCRREENARVWLMHFRRMTVPPNALAAIGIAFGAWLAARTGRGAVLVISFAGIAIISLLASQLLLIVLHKSKVVPITNYRLYHLSHNYGM